MDEIERKLRHSLSAHAHARSDTEHAWRRILADVTQSQSGAVTSERGSDSRWRTILVAAIISGLTFSLAVVAFRSSDRDIRPPAPAAGVTGSVPTVELTAEIDVGGMPFDLVSSGGEVWVAVQTSHGDRMVRIDSAGGVVTGSIGVSSQWDYLTPGPAGVWGAQLEGSELDRGYSVRQLDTSGEVAAELSDTSGPLAMAADALWATSPDHRTLLQLDPVTGAKEAEVELPEQVYQLAGDGTSIWAVAHEADRFDVIRVDAQTAEVTGKIDLPGSGIPLAPVVGEGMVYVPVLKDGAVSIEVIDVSSDAIVDSVETEGAVPISSTDTGLWLLGERGDLYWMSEPDRSISHVAQLPNTPTEVGMMTTATYERSMDAIWVSTSSGFVMKVEVVHAS